MRYPSYSVQKIYLDTKRNVYFLEQDINYRPPFGLSYNNKGIFCYVADDQYKQVGDSMERTLCADKYSNYELKVIEETYPGIGLRYFLAREFYKEPTANEIILTAHFFEMINHDF